jgi:hypothetical protein
MFEIYLSKTRSKYIDFYNYILESAREQNFPKFICFDLESLILLLKTNRTDKLEELKDCLCWLHTIWFDFKVSHTRFNSFDGGAVFPYWGFSVKENIVDIQINQQWKDFLPLIKFVCQESEQSNE